MAFELYLGFKERKAQKMPGRSWYPEQTYLETAELDKPVDYFCEVAHARAEAFSSVDK